MPGGAGTVIDVAPFTGSTARLLRPDDEPAVVRKRIAVFEQQTRPVFEFFRRHYKVVEVDASRSIDEVTEALRRALDRYDHS